MLVLMTPSENSVAVSGSTINKEANVDALTALFGEGKDRSSVQMGAHGTFTSAGKVTKTSKSVRPNEMDGEWTSAAS